MSPVHVLVCGSPEAEQAYGAPFGGAVQLYRFASNVEAFERLTSAAAPIDVVVITPWQDGLFNMTADQLAQRLVALPLSPGSPLHATRIVILGATAVRHPRVHAVADLDAAVRLVKFGHVESAPRPAPPAPELRLQPAADSLAAQPGASPLADSVISAIWDAPAPAAAAPAAQQHVGAGAPRSAPGRSRPAAAPAQPATSRVRVGRGLAPASISGGGPSQLFAHTPSVPAHAPAPTAPAAPPAAAALHAAQPYVLPGRGAYRGPGSGTALRYGATRPARQADVQQAAAPAPPQHLPPALAAQMRQVVYGGGTPADPVLGWSAEVQRELAIASAQPHQPHVGPPADIFAQVIPAAGGDGYYAPHPAAHLPHHANGLTQPPAPAGHVQPPPAVATVAPGSQFEASSQLLQRAEQGGGVSFG